MSDSCEGGCGCRLAPFDGGLIEVVEPAGGTSIGLAEVGARHTPPRCRIIRAVREAAARAAGPDARVVVAGVLTDRLTIRITQHGDVITSTVDLSDADARGTAAAVRDLAGSVADTVRAAIHGPYADGTPPTLPPVVARDPWAGR